MATVSAQTIQIAGTQATYNAASAGGDKFAPGIDTALHVKNASAGSLTVTVVTPNTVVGQAIADVTVTVPAGEERFIGPFARDHFAGDDGLVSVTWSATTSITFAVVNL